jgi:hypothetical protein
MQVHGENVRHAHSLQQVGNHFGGDGHAGGARAAVLAGVAEIRDDGADTLGRGALERVDHDQQFHQVVVGGGAGGLHDKHVTGAYVLIDLNGNFAIREAAYRGSAQLDVQMGGNFLGHHGVGIAGKNHEIRV